MSASAIRGIPQTPEPTVESDVPEAFVRALTVDAAKAAAYCRDPYFRSGVFGVGSDDAALRSLFSRTLVVLKPDAAAGRRIEAVLDVVRRHEFVVVAVAPFRFTPLLTRELWRYQFNIATRDRADVVDLLLPAADSLALVLEDTTWTPNRPPAACRFGEVKGPADPALRRPDHLRSRLAAPTTLFNFVHTADEPADVLRESALLDVAGGLGLVRGALGQPEVTPVLDTTLGAAVERVYAQAPAHDLDASAAAGRVLARYADLVVRPEDGLPDWRALRSRLGDAPADTGLLWDLLSIATTQIECNVPGLAPLVPSVKAPDWAAAGRIPKGLDNGTY